MNRLFQELARLDDELSDRLEFVYNRITWFGIMLLGVLILDMLLNFVGCRMPSIIMALIVTPMIIWFAYNPRALLAPFGVMYVIDRMDDLGEKIHLLQKDDEEDLTERVLKIYTGIVLETILWFCFISLIIGVFPLWGRFAAGLIVVLALIAFKVASTLLHKPPIFARVAHTVSIIVFIIGLGYMGLSFILSFPSVQARIGWSPFDLFASEQTSIALNGTDEVIKKQRAEIVKDQVLLVRAREIDCLNKGIIYSPTPTEMEFLEQARRGGLKTFGEVAAEMAEKSKSPPPKQAGAGGKGGWVLHDRLTFKVGEPNGQVSWLPPGTYRLPDSVRCYLGKSERKEEKKEVTVDRLTVLTIGSDNPRVVEIYKKI